MKTYAHPLAIASLALLSLLGGGCATLTEDPMTPVALSFSDGSQGKVSLTNKRGAWEAKLPSTVSVRKSDDGLRYEATTNDGRRSTGVIPSTMGAKIIASAVFIDFGIVDAITDKHREYPASYVIGIEPSQAAPQQTPSQSMPAATTETRLAELERLRKDGVISNEEYEKKRREIIDKL